MNDWLHLAQGDAPLIVSVPHAGIRMPDAVSSALMDPAAALVDTDWHVDKLYSFARDLGATLVSTAMSRIVVDVNRDPSGASLYPGQATTGLCPMTSFDGTPLYRAGQEPDAAAVAARRASFFDPYHSALDAEIARLRGLHGTVVVYDAHSIASRVPRLFDGELPAFSIGTNGGSACDAALTERIASLCPEPRVVNGRFRGGWITRRIGNPAAGVHAVQMELAQRVYLDEPSTEWNEARAAEARATLRKVLEACIDFAAGSQ
ncbi:N-formylglutamate deformylase [Novosphingobium sp.]|uniref:N-formylglutamate deformylase n=1 Tax=Novosphingobium sp. TaxID=1874826 RepID=UPI001D5A37B7|nr:N-formylglutamate deformylase [Novosphingobium sp.]MBX9665640.1 N-formylglutamate deformylase [Novosphingobium sp.]